VVTAHEKYIHLNKDFSFESFLELHIMEKNDTESFFFFKYPLSTVSCKSTVCSGKYFKQTTGKVLDKKKIEKLVYFSEEAWFTFGRNVSSQITDIDVQKLLMQFMEFLSVTLV
jgi:hypothetical protein